MSNETVNIFYNYRDDVLFEVKSGSLDELCALLARYVIKIGEL